MLKFLCQRKLYVMFSKSNFCLKKSKRRIWKSWKENCSTSEGDLAMSLCKTRRFDLCISSTKTVEGEISDAWLESDLWQPWRSSGEGKKKISYVRRRKGSSFVVKHTVLSTPFILVVLIWIETWSKSWTGWYEDGGDYNEISTHRQEGKHE